MSEIMHEALKNPKRVKRHIQKLKKAEIKKEKKFLVINRKFFAALEHEDMSIVSAVLEKLASRFPQIRENNYIVCNQDEPYAEEVWQVILEGERKKKDKKEAKK